MQNYYSPMSAEEQDGWPLKLNRISRGFFGRHNSHKAPSRLHERRILSVETPELDMVDILSATINTTPETNLNARPVHIQQTTLEDSRRFNVLDTKKKDRKANVFVSMKRKISDHRAPYRHDATRETPSPFDIQERASVDILNSDLPKDCLTRIATPKSKPQPRSTSPILTAKSLRRKLSRKFSRQGKGLKLGDETDTAYPSDLKTVFPDATAYHPACVVEPSTSTTIASASLPCGSRSLRRKFSCKDLRRPAASTSTSSSRPSLSSENSSTIRRMLSSSTLRSNGRIVKDVPVMEAEAVLSPPPTYSISMDCATKEKPPMDVLEHTAFSNAGVTPSARAFSSSSDNQLQTQITNLTESASPIPVPSRSRALSNAQTVRSSFDPYGNNNITTQYTHDTVTPLLIRRATRGSSPKRFLYLKRSLSELKSSRPTPSRSQSQDTGANHLSANPRRTMSTRSKSYYTLGSSGPAVPGASRSLTVQNAKRNSTISSRSMRTSISGDLRNSVCTNGSVPHESEFLSIRTSPAPLRNFSRPGSGKSATQEIQDEKNATEKGFQQVPRRAKKPDFLKMFDVPNLMMDCGGYDEHSYEVYTYSELVPYSTGQMIRDLSEAGKEGERMGMGEKSGEGEFEKFMEDAKREAREQRPCVMGEMGV